jgi:integrase/recombinase XerD
MKARKINMSEPRQVGAEIPPQAGKSFKDYLTEKQFSEKTIRIYESGIKDFLEWTTQHHYPIENIRYADLMNYIKYSQKKGSNKRNVQQQLLSLRHYFNYLVKSGKIKSNPAQGVYIRGIARRLPHDLAEYDELVKLYESYPVNDIRDQRNKVILGLLIFQGVTIEELELLESEHINLREGKIKVPGTDRTNERVLKLEAAQVFELQEYLNKTRNRILYGPKVNEPEKIKQLIIGMEGGAQLAGEVGWMMKRLKHEKIKQASQIRASAIAEWTKKHDVRIVQYMSGHKYVSTTERYQSTHLEDLQEQLRVHHPLK